MVARPVSGHAHYVSCEAELRRLLGGDRAPSLLVVVAHPDDETIGAGALIGALADVRVLFTTDGAPRDQHDAHAAGLGTRGDYAEARRQEALAALDLAGIPPERVGFLGFVDQELAGELASAARRVREAVGAMHPDAVLTHAYEGGHPDHDATAFAVHAALALDGGGAPPLVEMGLYHERDGEVRRLELLPDGHAAVTCRLSRVEESRKRAMLERYVTQREVLAGFPRDVERFRRAPRYDFTAPPHPGRLHYERYQWGTTGDGFRRHAGEALAALGLPRVI